ncbi:MAG: polyisoprenyl-teichoic acid--peptidoglycan teichoic acid transferase [Gaiellales bacterium]|nr:polyisoprenyl-teichoic acid--peptidoglycan teichoic acid transferase [Gaiellales bacterium]
MQFGGGMFRPPSPINVYTARRPHKRWTFWRILRWTLAVVLMSGVTVGGAVAYYVWNRLERITTTNDPNLKAADQQLAPVVDAASQPAVGLVLGYDKRYGSGNARGHSDTLMLIRVDPKTKILSLLSLPRDMYVNVPGMGMRKINDAYAYGGAPLAIQTVSQVLGVKINYYVPVNFHLFRKTVDIFHGVYIDVDRRYYHANNSAGNYAAIDLQPGYQRLSGFQALEYVRYRHLDSDFIRTARQQAFVREFKRRLDVWSAGTNLFSLLDTLPNDLKVRGSAKGQSVGPKTILSYVRLLAEIPRGNMVQVRLTGTTPMINGASVVQVAPDAIANAVAEFKNPNPAISQQVASRVGGKLVGAKKPAKKKGPKPIVPGKLRVVTVNGSGVQSVATQAKVELQKAGWPHTTVGGTLPQTNLFSTHVYYTNARAHLSAEKLRRSLGDTTASVLLPAAMSDFGLDADVVVAIGSAFSGVTPPPAAVAKAAAPPVQRPLVQAASPSDPGDFFLLQKRVGYRLLYPSKVPLYSTYREAIETESNAFRVYPLGKHGKALAVDARTAGDSSHAWGLRYTTWTDAPILEQPTRQVCWDKHQVRVYTNGPAIHRIAVFYGGEACKTAGGVVVWIDNSLDDTLSPETMIAIARSMVPAHRAPA